MAHEQTHTPPQPDRPPHQGEPADQQDAPREQPQHDARPAGSDQADAASPQAVPPAGPAAGPDIGPDAKTNTGQDAKTQTGSAAPDGRRSVDVGQAQPLSEALARQIDAAMDASTPPASAGGTDRVPGGQHPASPQRPSIRGPRVVGGAGRPALRTGTVVNVTEQDVFLEFGPKELGIVPREQWRPGENVPQAGQELEVTVERFDEGESIYICGRPGAIRKAIWDTLQPGQVIEATCVGINKGGLEMALQGGHRAFMPASQVALERVEDLESFVGQKLSCQVQRVERRGGGNVVLSRRAVLEAQRAEEAQKLKDQLHVGQVVEGTVRRIAPFGAFVDIGGIDGLVHVSDLSHQRIGQGEQAVRKVVKEGQRVRVEVLKLDWENNRISLGMKQLESDPFAEQIGQIEEGAEVSGRVTRIAEFGAFVEIAPGVEGLVHISELDHKRVRSVAEAVKQDEVVKVKVLGIEPGKRRISLSIKALKPAPASTQGKKGKGERGPSAEEILKETPALRRLREKFGGDLKGGLG